MPESLDIYDTNVWIFGLHDPDSQAGTLVQEAIHGNRRVRLNAYLYQEVVRNLDDGLDPQASKQITTAFATFVKESETIFGPTQKQIEKVDIQRVRQEPDTRMFADAIGCEPKDAPIVKLAYLICENNRDGSTIFTNDGGNETKLAGLVDVDFSRYCGTRPNGVVPNPLGKIRTKYVPEPPSVS